MRVIAIIPVHTQSKRLPKKFWLDLIGKPMLQHIYERVSRAKRVDKVVIAMPLESEQLYMAINERFGGETIAPSVPYNDIAGRLAVTAQIYGADYVVRIGGDSPAVDPVLIDMLVEHAVGVNLPLLFSNVGNYDGAQGWPDGFGAEVYSTDLLWWINRHVDDAGDREHIHRIFHRNKLVSVPPSPYLSWSNKYCIEVNTPEEYDQVRVMYEHFGHNEFDTLQVMGYLDALHLA